MFRKVFIFVSALIFPSISVANTPPTVEDMRGIMYVCSQGYSKSTEIGGNIDIDALSLRLFKLFESKAGVRGQINEEEVGAITEKIFTDEGKIEAFKLYQDCLNRHLYNLMRGGELSGPGVQRTRVVTLIAQDARIAEDTAIIIISAKFHLGTVGWYQLEPSTFSAVSSGGGVFRLVDDGGLHRGFKPDAGDNVSMTLIFERTNGTGKDKDEDSLNVSGSLDRYVNSKTRHTTPIGLRDIPVRK